MQSPQSTNREQQALPSHRSHSSAGRGGPSHETQGAGGCGTTHLQAQRQRKERRRTTSLSAFSAAVGGLRSTPDGKTQGPQTQPGGAVRSPDGVARSKGLNAAREHRKEEGQEVPAKGSAGPSSRATSPASAESPNAEEATGGRRTNDGVCGASTDRNTTNILPPDKGDGVSGTSDSQGEPLQQQSRCAHTPDLTAGAHAGDAIAGREGWDERNEEADRPRTNNIACLLTRRQEREREDSVPVRGPTERQPTQSAHTRGPSTGEHAAKATADAEASPQRRGGTSDQEVQEFPLRELKDLQAYLAKDGAPRVLVAFEFSGALRTALGKAGINAISADVRPSEVAGPHYQGEVREIAAITEWEMVFAVGPNCFQTLRADDQCLPLKMRDGRSFWGIATVLWCACLPNVKALLIEQPDTIAEDFLRLRDKEDCEVVEVRTTQYGDEEDKFMRFTTRNMTMPPVRSEAAGRAARQPRSQFQYANAEQRDKHRSSWARFPRLCEAISQCRPAKDDKPKRMRYEHEVEELAEKWRESGLPLPWDYANSDARPTSKEDQEYQRVRGVGDGRDVTKAPTAQIATRRTESTRTAEKRYPHELRPEEAGVIIVPIEVQGDTTYALTPTNHTKVFGMTKQNRTSAAATEAAQNQTEGIPEVEGKAIPIRVGQTDEGVSVVATLTRGQGRGARARDLTQRKGLGLGRVALWCTIGALFGGTPQATWTQLAISAVQQYAPLHAAENTWAALEEAARQATGARPGKGPMWAPRTGIPRDGGGMTPRDLITRASVGTEELRHALWKDDGPLSEYYRQWSDSIRPLELAEVPDELLDKPLDLAAQALKSMLFAKRLPTYKLPWLPRMPEQEPLGTECAHFRPTHAAELLDATARNRVERWIEQATRDLECLERLGPECDRSDRPPILAIGPEEMHPCAQGRVWDCRQQGRCELLDYSAPIDTHWDLDYLRGKFEGYADQRLASNVLEGVRLEADIEHQVVLHPNLVSVGEGYDSVQKTVRELGAMGFYDFYEHMPFVPMYAIGQGSRIKRVGVRKYRRTSNFSAPHHETKDKSGRKVIAINGASKCYYAPAWLAKAKDKRLREWDEKRYAHVKWADVTQRSAHVKYKFPKEMKATLEDVLRDLWLLLDGSIEVGEQIFVIAEDAGFYFNQFGYAPEEYWKSTLVLGARSGDKSAAGKPLNAHQPLFIAEKRLGFGSFASSNLAQRFSNALVEWTLQRFDELEAEAGDTQAVAQWRARRRQLEPECRAQRPIKPDQAVPDCNQTRLATIHMYTDDPIMISVGVERTMRLLAAWHEVTGRANITMAGPEKRQIGAHVEWLGVLILVGIGIVVVPKHKLLRAQEALVRTLAANITFNEYRALVGLLEHLRFIARLEADRTNALYRPHQAQGEDADGPNATVRPDKLMKNRLMQWLDVIMHCGGATCTMVFTTDTLGRVAHAVYAASSDAAGDGRGTPGIGGYMHGNFWRIELPPQILKLMHITAWEMLAAAINILVTARLAGPTTQLAMRTDAALVPYAIVHHKSKSRDVQTIIHCLQQQPRYTDDARSRLTIEHLSGVANVFSDLVSRGLWDELEELFQALKIRGHEIQLDAEEKNLFERVLNEIENGIPTQLRVQRAGSHTSRQTLTPIPIHSQQEHAKQAGARTDRPRYLTPTERGTTKARSDSTDGDGPDDKFTPPWKIETTSPQPLLPRAESSFTPPWVRQRAADPSHRRDSHQRDPHIQDSPRDAHIRAIRRRASMQPPLPPPQTTALTTYTPPAEDVYLSPTGQHQLAPAEVAHAERLIQRLAADKSPGRIGASEAELRSMVMQTSLARQDGINPRTASKNSLAWREFALYAELRNFDPNLRTKWTRAFPERETLKLAGFVLFTAQRIKPRSKQNKTAKPQSIMQRFLALRRIFKIRGEELPPDSQINDVIKGLIRRFMRREGITQLRPKRVEPITPEIVEKLIRQAQLGTTQIRGKHWCLQERDCRNITTWQVANLQIGSRKGEATRLPGDTDSNDWFTRASLTVNVAGTTVIDPTPTQLRGMREGDYFLLAPKGAKCDQFGTCYGTDPIVLPFHDRILNPARWLRDLELQYPCRGPDRATTPLFARADGQPYSDGQFSELINLSLAKALGNDRAKLYSPHSWRVWLATALRAKGASDARIQAFGRWMSPDSIKIYSRITVQEYTEWQDKLMSVRTFKTAKTTSLPIMDATDTFAQE